MDETLLTELVRRQTTASVVHVLNRSIDVAAEEMARDILRDPAVRERLRTLVLAAFDATLAQLNEPRTPPVDVDGPA